MLGRILMQMREKLDAYRRASAEQTRRRAARAKSARRPLSLESLEDRTLLSATTLLPPVPVEPQTAMVAPLHPGMATTQGMAKAPYHFGYSTTTQEVAESPHHFGYSITTHHESPMHPVKHHKDHNPIPPLDGPDAPPQMSIWYWSPQDAGN